MNGAVRRGRYLLAALLALGSTLAEAQEEHRGEPFVWEFVRTAYRFDADGTGRIVSDHQALLQSQAGAHQLGQIIRPYIAGRSTLEVEMVEVTHPDGSVTPSPPSSIRDASAPLTEVFPVYSDIRMIHVRPPALRPGDRLRYRIVEHVEKPEAPGHFWIEHRFERIAVTLEERVEIDLPVSASAPVTGPAAGEPDVEERGDRIVRVWHRAQGTPGAPAEPEDLAPESLPADIQVSSFGSWERVAQWYRDLQGSRASPSPKLRQKALELVEGATTPREQIEAIYGYVSSEYRYLGLALGAHRYQPHAADDVLEAGYGDCKDKHTLLAALLEAAGHHAEPVLVGSLRGELTTELPSPAVFDHVITRVLLADEVLWVDATSQVARFGFLPPGVRGKRGLRVGASSETSGLVDIPEELALGAGESFALEGRIGDDGRLTASVEQSLGGDPEYLTRLMLLNSNGALRQGFVSQLAGALLSREDAEILDVETSDPTELDEPLRLSFETAVPNVLGLVGSERLAPIGPGLELPTKGEEDLRLTLGSYTRRFVVRLPEGTTATPPGPVAVDRGFASYTSDYRVDGDTLTAERALVVREAAISEKSLPEYEALRRTMRADAKQAFELRSAAAESLASSTDARQVERAASRAFDRKEYASAARLYERLLELEPGHATAWNQLGETRWYLEDYAGGLEAFARQIEVDPFHEDANSWLGTVHEKLEQTEQAESAYRRQLDNLPLDWFANQRLGRLLAKGDRCPEAMPFLHKAASVSDSDCGSRIELLRCNLGSDRIDAARENLLGLPASCSDRDLNRAANLAEEKLREDAVQVHLRAAEKGSNPSRTDLGWAYQYGRGAARDDLKAVEWYRKAAEEGYAGAQWRLGSMYEHGHGVTADLATAASWYRRAAEQGDASGQLYLADLLSWGEGVEEDASQAAEWYQKAADQGNAIAQNELGELYARGRGVERDHARALELFRQAAEGGNARAQVNLGWQHQNGLGVEKDPARAAELYRRAAEQGDSRGQMRLAWLFDEGLGVERDDGAALEWYQKAALQGHLQAQTNLGWLYALGRGGEADLPQALEWFQKAADEDYAPAQLALGSIYDGGRGVPEDASLAASWYRKAAEQGSRVAQYHLGRFLMMGRGVEQDLVESCAWLSVATVDEQVRTDALKLIQELHGYMPDSDLQQARTRAAELHSRFPPGR